MYITFASLDPYDSIDCNYLSILCAHIKSREAQIATERTATRTRARLAGFLDFGIRC